MIESDRLASKCYPTARLALSIQVLKAAMLNLPGSCVHTLSPALSLSLACLLARRLEDRVAPALLRSRATALVCPLEVGVRQVGVGTQDRPLTSATPVLPRAHAATTVPALS